MGDLVSVKEFSKLAEVTSQAVYKRLQTDLKPYATKVGNRTMIDIKALEEVYSNNVTVKLHNQEPTENNQVVKPLKVTSAEEKLIEELQKDKERLYSELETKNEQIKNLTETVNSLSEQLSQSQLMLLREQETLHLLQTSGQEPHAEDLGDVVEVESLSKEEVEKELTKEEPKRKWFSWFK